MDPILRISSLTASYGSNPAAPAVLRNVTLELAAGDCLVVLGPNGSGKSTLLHAIAGSIEGNVTGEAVLEGRNLLGEPQHRRARQIAMVHQDPVRGTAAHLTLREHCDLTAIRGARESVTWARVQAQLASLGTDLDPNRPAGELSGGQRQLFTVLLAVLSEPRLLLLDEPTSALDSRHQALVQGVVKSSSAEHSGGPMDAPNLEASSSSAFPPLANAATRPGHATILVTHDLSEALVLGNRLLILTARGEVAVLCAADEKARLDEAALLSLLSSAASTTWLRK